MAVKQLNEIFKEGAKEELLGSKIYGSWAKFAWQTMRYDIAIKQQWWYLKEATFDFFFTHKVISKVHT